MSAAILELKKPTRKSGSRIVSRVPCKVEMCDLLHNQLVAVAAATP